MADDCDIEWVRRELIRLVRRKELRVSEWSAERPTHWVPDQVNNPATKMPFSHVYAWEFIAELLESGCEIGVILLDIPPGERGYVIKATLEDNKPKLYVKLQLSRGKVIGRSFHYDM